MASINYCHTKNNFSNALLESIFHQIKKGEVKANFLITKYNLSQTTAYRWVREIVGGKSLFDFKKRWGRPRIFSEEVCKDVEKHVSELSARNECISHQNIKDNVPTFTSCLIERQSMEEKKNLTGVVVKASKHTIKRVGKKCGFVITKAVRVSKRRIIACSDPLNAMSMSVVARYIKNTLDGNFDLLLNLDATVFELNKISESRGYDLVWVPEKLKKEFDNASAELKTYLNSLEGTGVFAKHLTLVCGDGDAAPFVFVVADKNLPPNTFKCEKIKGLGISSGIEGYVVVSNSRNPCADFYMWYYEQILLPFVDYLREKNNFCTDLTNPKEETMPYVLWLDGENNQLKPLLHPQLHKTLNDKRIFVIKGPGATTNITQFLDTSPIFKNSHRLMKFDTNIKKYSSKNRRLNFEVNKFLVSVFKDRRQLTSLTDLITRATYALRFAVSPDAIENGMMKTGCFMINHLGNGYYDDEVIRKNFKVHNLSVAESICWHEDAERLLKTFTRYGSLTDSELQNTAYFAKYGVEANEKPLDRRTITQQRCVEVTNKYVLEKVLSKKESTKAPNGAKSKEDVAFNITEKKKNTNGRLKLNNNRFIAKVKAGKNKRTLENTHDDFYPPKKPRIRHKVQEEI